MARPTILALSLLVILALWMASGLLVSKEDTPQTRQVTPKDTPAMRVQVTELEARTVTQEVVIQGRILPLRQVEIKSQITGIVASVPIEKGSKVKKNDVLVILNVDDRAARIEQVKAQIKSLELDLTAAKKLAENGLNSVNLVTTAQADLARAQAELVSAELALNNTRIRASFDGVWDDRYVEEGSHLDVGNPIGLLVDNTTLRASGFVSQQAITQLQLGQTVSVKLLNGKQTQGTLSYISQLGEGETQSFRIEATIDNSNYTLNAGITAEIHIETGVKRAHFVVPSAFSLRDDGQIGLKSVDTKNNVVFYPIELIKKEADGVWVSGLPERVNIITLGQGFVHEGERVIAVKS